MLQRLGLSRQFSRTLTNHSRYPIAFMSGIPQIISSDELAVSEAKWITLKKIKFHDQEGRERIWESAERKTRGSSGIDAVAIFAVFQPKDKSPPATIIIEQFRPPVEKFVVEMPAGLIDEGETPERAAIRELYEETGFTADGVIETSPLMVSDPGMTSANMKLVTLRVPVANVKELEELPEQVLESGEFIVRRVVLLNELNQVLKEYAAKGFVVDAKLAHFAIGYDIAMRFSKGEIL